jgi:hypothetical protein
VRIWGGTGRSENQFVGWVEYSETHLLLRAAKRWVSQGLNPSYVLPPSTASVARRSNQSQFLLPWREHPVDQPFGGFDRGVLARGSATPDRALIDIDGPIPSSGCGSANYNVEFVAIFHLRRARAVVGCNRPKWSNDSKFGN